MLVVTNLPQFDATVKKWLESVKVAAEKAAIGIAYTMLVRAANTTPQYSGTTAANWRINYGSVDTSWDPDPLGYKGDRMPHFSRGSSYAVNHARSTQAGKLAGFTLGQTIYISNNTQYKVNQYGFGNLAAALEDGKIRLRPANGAHYKFMAQAARTVSHRYRIINKLQLKTLIGANLE